MTTIYWPSELTVAATLDIGIEYDVQMNVGRSGALETYGLPGARFVCTVGLANDKETRYRPRIEALIVSLRGGARLLSMHHLGRPVPLGTLRGSPTLDSPASAGASTLALANCNGTLEAGDLIGLPGQVVFIEASAAPSGGKMTVSISPATRAAHNAGTTVTWNKPPILWIPKSSTAGPFPFMAAGVRPAFSVELVEVA